MNLAEQTKGNSGNGCRRSTLGGCSCVTLTLLALVLLPAVVYLALVATGALLIVSDPVQRVDAVVVLSGGAGDRLALAVEMHAEGYAPFLVITDTSSGMNNRMVREAVRGGFPRERIFVTDLQVESTYDEALAVRDLALQQNWTSLMVVTDPYHTFRTRLIFNRELRGSGIEILVHPVRGHWFNSRTWFFRPEGWQMVLLELGKLINDLFLRG